MDVLHAAGWHTITAGELAADLAARRAPPARTLVITFDDGWSDGYTHAYPILARDGFVATFFVISSRIGSPSFLSATQMRALIAAGDEIGNHTVDHRSLRGLTPSEVRWEVETASERIAQATGARPRSFAYPHGAQDSTIADAVSQCPGIEIALSEGRTIGETYATRFRVPRLDVGPEVPPAMLLSWLGG